MMPKQKTRKSLIKRFRITKTGKVMRRQGFRRHLRAGKSQKRLRNLKKALELKGFYAKKIRKVTGSVRKASFFAKATKDNES
ncbi:50S ribosomal protein L35 [Candidatus Woesebacteria bacterium CG07_land_8_20_14_0_80_44_9]|uniref:Large ribosomal subunit protein bL35 n=3 Tax=Candidatus Woeseibacteriota TaxID=1752722 RepID=A0A2H0BHM4_9BACT|nr:MAG: 50S ribosomal protein L35 [Candidatus Woesebacteria bacterium CG22_combo_CG10-13_8_21_14_all_45_10]PIU28439.1 MAG: 50S ribosomal protein L35 [Candidatus Woesebacteria bacterium CG07_land_8_20_14_0_80_44_9]PIZ46489.1 MAG: 50S ribosomal protein L35 [Candidatus Woesebacteria bacterium CG_4_10_14_0_2_um_filter_44_9]